MRIDDTVSRLGGDEFLIILPDIAQVVDARLVAEKILDSFKQPIKINGQEITISTSIGIAVYNKVKQTLNKSRCLILAYLIEANINIGHNP